MFSLLLIGIVALFVLNGLFFFKGTFTSISNPDYEIRSDLFLSLKKSIIGNIPLPIPSHYIAALDAGMVISSETGYLFFLGEYFIGTAPKSFYFVSFFVKSTLPVIILFVSIHLLFFLLILSKNNNEKIVKIKFMLIYLMRNVAFYR